MTSIYSSYGQALDTAANMGKLQARLAEFQTQLSTGKKTQTFGGLGVYVLSDQRSRADLSQIAVYQSNIQIATPRIKQMKTSISEFQAQGKTALASMTGEIQKGNIDLGLVKQFAHDTLSYLKDLLNTRDADRYLLSGADADTPPMNDTGAMGTAMTKMVEDWKNGTITTDQLLAGYKAVPDTTMGYSATLTSGLVKPVFVRADTNVEVNYTVLANDDGFKDVLKSLALIDSIDIDKIYLETGDDPLTTETAPGADADAQKDNFWTVYNDAINTLRTGLNQVKATVQRLEKVEVTLNDINTQHKQDKNALDEIVSNIEDADITDVAVRANFLQIQLDASYRMTAALGNLTLSNYL